MGRHAARSALFFAAALAAALTLAACSSGGGGNGDDEIPDALDLVSEPRGQRLQAIVEDSDTLLIPGLRAEYSFSVGDQPAAETILAPAAACTGVSCAIGTGTTILVQHIFDLSAGVVPGEGALGQRGGFDTLESAGRLRLGDTALGEDLQVFAPSVTNYGLWGQYGFAGVSIGTDSLEGSFQLEVEALQTAVPISGNVAMAFAAGNVNGLNPTGVGEAIWEGIAEAVSTRTFQRRTGTARVLISNLSSPMANVYIRLDETLIGPTGGWTNLAVTAGGFTSGARGVDYLQGNFHGPMHEETYGVFDTDAYTGAFGAMRGN